MPERFQPRTVASFNSHQLRQVFDWFQEKGFTITSNAADTISPAFFSEVWSMAETDEKGKPLNEKGRNRLYYGLLLLAKMAESPNAFMDIQGEANVWQMSAHPSDIEFRWKRKGDSLESRASKTRFLGKV